MAKKTAAKKAVKTVETKAAPKAEVKAVETKTAPKAEVKAVETKTAPKTEVKAVETKAAPKAESKAAVKAEVFLQFAGKEVRVDEVVSAAEAAFAQESKAALKSVKVYLKPEENAAYYVANEDVTGKVEL